MAFQIKDAASITASVINWMKAVTKKITDFNIGSVARTLVEGPAIEMDELYQQMLNGLKEGIPVAVYNSFDFARQSAVPASGLVRVTITSQATDTLIPAGTSFKVEGKSVAYTSTQNATIPTGDTYVDVPVAADSAGVLGNLSAATAFLVAPTPAGYVSAENLTAFVNGRDLETDAQRKVRFNAFIASLARGTLAAVDYGLKLTILHDADGNETERVVTASIVEPYLTDPDAPVAWVLCYIHNGTGSTSSDLVTRAAEILHGYTELGGQPVPGWKAAGVKVEVFAAGEQAVAVTGNLTAAEGFVEADLIALAVTAIAEYIKALPIGKSAIRSEIIAIVMNIDGVYNFTVTVPSGDTTPAANVKLMPGTLTIT